MMAHCEECGLFYDTMIYDACPDCKPILSVADSLGLNINPDSERVLGKEDNL